MPAFDKRAMVFMLACSALPSAALADISSSLALVSDYRFRGISQNWGDAALQAGAEYSWDNGAYAGTWLANVSDDVYYGGSYELDLYGGWRGTLHDDVSIDIGLLRYVYPGAEASLADSATADAFDTTEIYVSSTRGWLNVKLSYALSDYFGVNDAFVQNVGICANTAGTPGHCAPGSAVGPGRGDSNGSWYAEANVSLPTGDYGDVVLHAGRLSVANYEELDVTDFRLGWSMPLGWATFGVAWHANSAEDGYYRLTASDGDVFAADDEGVVVSLGATF